MNIYYLKKRFLKNWYTPIDGYGSTKFTGLIDGKVTIDPDKVWEWVKEYIINKQVNW